jgi:hypothetical protein
MSNIVVVPEKEDKIRVCLPHIDMFDNAAHSSTYSFMDGSLGYNQIKMTQEDKEKKPL